MSGQLPPEKPKPKHISKLQSEPVPMSFASPQFLAQIPTNNYSTYSAQQMKTVAYPVMPKESGEYNKIAPASHTQSVQHAASINANSDIVVPVTGTNTTQASAGPTLTGLLSEPIDTTTFRGFKFVTLDGMLVETREVYDKISGTFQWEMCESQDTRCIEFIRNDCINRRVFLITSGGLGQQIVPKIHDLPQVYCIYIYCANVKFHREWSEKYSKVRVVCDNDDLYLIPQFAVDVAQANIDWGNGYLKAGNREKAKEKFKLASDKLNNYARNHDPAMDVEIKKKLDECQ